MGLNDEIGNFTLSLNNPSSQIEALELEDLNKRLAAMQTALADPGTGIPMMSMRKALKDIMKMSDSDIKDMFNEIRLEKAMAAELAATANIIKKTGIFDTVDRIYGDYDAMNNPQPQQSTAEGEDDGMEGMGSIGGGPMGDFGGDMDMDLGEPGSPEEGDLGGDMGETDMGNAPDTDTGQPLMEVITRRKKLNIQERNNMIKTFTQKYFDMLSEGFKEETLLKSETEVFDGKVATINNSINEVYSKIDKLVNEEELEKENLINEAIENTED